MKRIEIIGYKGLPLVGYLWNEVQKPKAVVQIIHGMQEHATRYDEFAKFLNTKGYIVYASDLRGHGETAISVDKQGYSEGDIFEEVVNDQIIISNTIKEKMNLPLYVIGHSFGSFVTQMYMTRCNLADKIVLSGSAYTNTSLMGFANMSAHINCAFVGRDKKARFIEKNSFGSYGKKFKHGNWLTRDEEIFKLYRNDPYCGKSFPYSFYCSMFKGILKNYKEIDKIREDVKILIISGDSDPVGGYGKLVTKLYNTYRKQGLLVECKLYPGARHEVLNETNRQEVYNDVISFFKK